MDTKTSKIKFYRIFMYHEIIYELLSVQFFKNIKIIIFITVF